MASPIASIRYIHQAIRAESAALAVATASLNESSDPAPLIARAALFARVVHLHTSGEEVALFGELDKRAPDIAGAYVLDHREETAHFEAVAALLRDLPGSSPSDAQRIRTQLHAATAVLAAHTRLHIRKEEELLVPLFDRCFSQAEQAELIGRMLRTFPPEDMQRAIPWLITLLEPAERVSYLSEMQQAMPADRFAGVTRLLSGALSPSIWEGIVAAMPDLR